MRPVNLIPPEERRGEHAPLRTGPDRLRRRRRPGRSLLAGVTALVLTGNQISERKAEVAQLQQEDAAASAAAERLAAYTQFQALREQRVATVTQPRRQPLRLGARDARTLAGPAERRLARRPDRDRRPGGSRPAAAGGVRLRLRGAASPGPALELSGCAPARRRWPASSPRSRTSTASPGSASSPPNCPTAKRRRRPRRAAAPRRLGDDCRTRDFIAKFEIVVAFDAAPVPIADGAEEAAGARRRRAARRRRPRAETSEDRRLR